MHSYRFNASILTEKLENIVRNSDGAYIPFNPDNRDYQQFLKDWEAGAEVLNPDGTPAPYVAPETP
jgi:hypothetical protein